MCVIITIEKGQFPKYQTLKEAEILNAHGGSIAWLESGKINYQRGIKAKKIQELIDKRLKPNKVKTAIIHFRIASVGTINKDLCHPFPISEKVESKLKVEDSKYDVLFHNGTVSEWQTMLIDSLQKFSGQIPKGELSDSRVIAFLLNRHGTDLIKDSQFNKFSILTKKGIVKFGSWVKVGKNECSNDYFVKTNEHESYLKKFWGLGNETTPKSFDKKQKGKNSKSLKVYKTLKGTVKSRLKKLIKTQQDKKYYHLCKNDFYVTDDEIEANLNEGLSMIEVYDLLESSYGNKKQWINGDFVPSWEKEQQDQDYLSIQEWNDKYGFVESEY